MRRKFRIGQVVFVDELGWYAVVMKHAIAQDDEDDSHFWYALKTNPSEGYLHWPERELRSLTKREIGKADLVALKLANGGE